MVAQSLQVTPVCCSLQRQVPVGAKQATVPSLLQVQPKGKHDLKNLTSVI